MHDRKFIGHREFPDGTDVLEEVAKAIYAERVWRVKTFDPKGYQLLPWGEENGFLQTSVRGEASAAIRRYTELVIDHHQSLLSENPTSAHADLGVTS